MQPPDPIATRTGTFEFLDPLLITTETRYTIHNQYLQDAFFITTPKRDAAQGDLASYEELHVQEMRILGTNHMKLHT